MIPPHLLPAYEECRRIQQHHGKTYYFSTLLFPKDVRPHVNALYGFVRYPDELVDNPVHATIPERCRAVRQFRMQTIQAHANKSVENPILHAFGHTMRTMGIQLKDALDFLDAMESDLTISRYKTYAELQKYMRGSASCVGRMMCPLLGVDDEKALTHAAQLGEAMQVTNFLRDIKEDYARGRIYMPLEDMERFGVTEDHIKNGIVDDNWKAFMRFQIERNRHIYAEADKGLLSIPPTRRKAVACARVLYSDILTRIEKNQYDVFNKRAATTLSRKLFVAGSILFGMNHTRLAHD